MFRYVHVGMVMFMANLSVNVYHFAGDKPEKVCKDEEQSKGTKGVKEACNLYYKYAKTLHA